MANAMSPMPTETGDPIMLANMVVVPAPDAVVPSDIT